MFDAQKLIQTGPQRLALQTRKGSDIKNEIALPPEGRQVRKYEQMRAKHPNWRNRKSACGTYNCCGHLFASRRTAIYDDHEDTLMALILSDDEYTRIPYGQMAIGDVALYRDSLMGIVHVGQIVEVKPATATGLLAEAWVLSKWDDTCGEDCHLISDVPFNFDKGIEIWTERR